MNQSTRSLRGPRLQASRLRVRRLLLAIGCSLATTLPSCSFSPKEPDPDWQVSEIESVSRRLLWELSIDGLEALGYSVSASVDPSMLELSTGWKTQLAPFRGKGVRKRAQVRYEPLEDSRYAVRVRVAAQANMAINDPLDPRYAEWEWRPDDVGAAQIIMQRLRAEVGTEFQLENESGSFE